MSIPSTPQELSRRMAALDQERLLLERKVQEAQKRRESTDELRDALERVESERVRLQFYVGAEVAVGKPPREAEAPKGPSVDLLPVRRPSTASARRLIVPLLTVVVVAAVYWLNRPAAPTSRVEPVGPEPEPAPLPVDRTIRESSVPSAAQPPEPAAADAAAPEQAAEAVWWKGSVGKSPSGVPRVGAECTLTTTIRRPGLGDISGDAVVAKLGGGASAVVVPRLECDGELVYEPSGPAVEAGAERTQRAFLWERPGASVGEYEMWLQYEDLGARSSSYQIRVDTPAKRIVLWRDSPTQGAVVITVEPWAKRRGQAWNVGASPTTIGFLDIDREGRVTTATGAAAASPGQLCTFRLIPISTSRHSCRANVACGGNVLYGAGNTGYLDCSFVDGVPTKAFDAEADDGDAIFDMDLEAGTLAVSSDLPNVAFRVTISLAP